MLTGPHARIGRLVVDLNSAFEQDHRLTRFRIQPTARIENQQVIHDLERVPLSQTAAGSRSMRGGRVGLRPLAVACCVADRDPRASTSTRRSSAFGQAARLTKSHRFFWAWLSQAWVEWRSAIVIVKPETVLAWRRESLRLFWTWKVRHGQPGRPTVFRRYATSFARRARANPL